MTNSGGGALRWLDFDVTRWHADTTCDVPGTACYIRDLESGTIWSNTHQPVRSPERRYTWSFTPDKAEFRRRSGPCETITEIAVSAEDDAEIRRVTLVNTSRKTVPAGADQLPRARARAAPDGSRASRIQQALRRNRMAAALRSAASPGVASALPTISPSGPRTSSCRAIDSYGEANTRLAEHLMVGDAPLLSTRSSLKPTARNSSAGVARWKIPKRLPVA